MSKLVVRKRATGRALRRKRVRKKISGTAKRPRLTVFRGNRNMSCQVIDDELGVTIAAASTNEKEFGQAARMPKIDAAKMLGAAIVTRAQESGVTTVVFDRSGYKYHGRVKAMADAARENGLIF